jgi:hypothetical protein
VKFPRLINQFQKEPASKDAGSFVSLRWAKISMQGVAFLMWRLASRPAIFIVAVLFQEKDMPTIDQFTNVLGILGAYFVMVLVLAVSVETILEPFTWWFRGLRKKVSPDDVLNDIKGWLPPIADMGTRAAAIANLAEEYQLNVRDIQKRFQTIRTIADETAKGLGVHKQVDDTEKMIAVYMAALRNKFALDERKRIAALRMLSGLVGIAIALMLKIDTFDIIGFLFPENVRVIFTTPGGQIGGILITGLAASAGSSFWHDQLGRLRAIKESVKDLR